MTAPASPPVAVGVELRLVIDWLEQLARADDLDDIAADGGVTVAMVYQQEAAMQARRLRALASPEGAVVGWPTVAREALECIAAAKQTSMKTPNTYAGGFDAGCHWASGVAERALAKLAPSAASRSPGMETLQASECTKHGEGDQ